MAFLEKSNEDVDPSDRHPSSVLRDKWIKTNLGQLQTLVVILPEEVREPVGEKRNRIQNAIAINVCNERRELACRVLPERLARASFQCKNIFCRTHLLVGYGVGRARHHAGFSARLTESARPDNIGALRDISRTAKGGRICQVSVAG